MSKLDESPRKIPLLVPNLPTQQDLAPYLARIDAAHWYTNFGPLVRELEASMETLFTADSPKQQHVVTVANATVGMELAILALELPPGSRILIPALTFAASAAAVLRAGCIPVFCDVEPDTWLLSPAIARRALRRIRCDVVMPVSTFGCPQDTSEWDEFALETGVKVLIDAAGAFGNQAPAQECIVVFSLHATKAFPGGEGGLLVTADAAFAARVRMLSNFGIDPSAGADDMAGTGGLVQVSGTNGKMSEYHAAVALASYAKWADIAAKRVALHQTMLGIISDLGAAFVTQHRPVDGAYFVFPVLVPQGSKAVDAWKTLLDLNIETRRWYCPPLHLHPAFSKAPRTEELPVVTAIGERLIALPFHLSLSPDDVTRVRAALAEFSR